MASSSIQKLIALESIRNALLILNDGPKDVDRLALSVNTTRENLHSVTGLLEEHYLINKKNGSYELTSIGELVVSRLQSLLSIEKAMNAAGGYWRSRNLEFIPPALLKKLHKLDPCTLVQPGFPDMYDYNREVHEMSKSSCSVSVAAACLHPSFPELFSDLLERDVSLSLILDRRLLDKIKRDNPDEVQKLMEHRQVQVYLSHREMPFLSIKVNDACIELKLLTDEGVYDNKRLVCCSPDAVEWGKELFEHYRQQSVEVSDI